MQVQLLIAIVVTVFMSEQAEPQSVALYWVRLALAIAAMLVPVSMALVGGRSVARMLRHGGSKRWRADASAALLHWYTTAWFGAAIAAATVLAWPRIVRYEWGFDQWPVIRDVLVTLPIWLPLVLSWMACYQVEHARRILHAVDEGNLARGAVRFALTRCRHQLVLALAPVLLLLAMHDAAACFLPTADRATVLLLVTMLGCGLVVVGFPLLLRCIWDTRPLEAGPLRDGLLAIASRYRLAIRNLVVWRTGDTVANAAVAGLVPGWRYVFVTEALLRRLDERQVVAVVLHEAAHIRRGHLALRLAALVSICCAAAALQRLVAGWTGTPADALIGGESEHLLVPAAGLLAVVLGAIVVVGRLSRFLEHDADLWAQNTLSQILAPDALEPPAGCLAGALCALLEREPRAQRKSWLHPSLAARLAVLRQAEQSASYLAAWRARFRRVAVLTSLSTAAAMLLACVA